MIDEILPEGAAVAATRGDLHAPLFPEEKQVIRRAIQSRCREFTTGRACARTALTRLGLPTQAIPSGPRGNPQWPTGIVGSITHCDGYRAAAVGRAREFATIGIDAEPNRHLPDGILEVIALPDELEWVRQLMHDTPDICWDRLLFSIKEAVYKAWFPLTARDLGFEDACVMVDRQRRVFSARLLVSGFKLGGIERSTLSGRWHIHDGLVVTAIAQSQSVDGQTQQ
jgi:4'-phosphopantetheinyl transferase EntD